MWPMSDAPTELGDTLRAVGYRLTGPRLLVWTVLEDSHHHLTAEQIAEIARERDPSVNLSSIYRSLALFDELGLVRESSLGTNSASHWEIAHPDEQFHLRCVSCGKIEHHQGDLVDQVRSHLSEEHGFQATDVELLVSGLCQDCAAAVNA
jgi:Fur family ferric uptake transcriptional regulator